MATITFLVGGARISSKNLWEITDDGATLSITNSYDIGSVHDVVALARDLEGNTYIATSAKNVNRMYIITVLCCKGRHLVQGSRCIQTLNWNWKLHIITSQKNNTGTVCFTAPVLGCNPLTYYLPCNF